ncbi:MAG: hypothetical protein Q7R87_01735 [Nanoarchaeota archaeon]|nr:hypothetical protein [Nanoarchaeota archaeon]
MKPNNILFICRFNRFRSRVAEAYFKKINKDKKIKSDSAGLKAGSYPLDSDEVECAYELGIDLEGKPKRMTEELANWADTIVIAADDVMPSFLAQYIKTKKKIIHWQIPENNSNDHEEIKSVINQIKNKVDELIQS